ncbi:pyroglutamyl-peptidase hypothetical protein [Limosa lapponica baueri]|uniref:Uncharacterized protein n=1 Tax=Limosa lapponica baueri TaxID=1758121 RepID=A0A2I0TF00_LIMLA|nr:pyroglutamyl-peptidase hypothetical protein [Limosa lapponica baueri]
MDCEADGLLPSSPPKSFWLSPEEEEERDPRERLQRFMDVRLAGYFVAAQAAPLMLAQVIISSFRHEYLCDFTYYTSLYQSCGRSAFVHVPPLGKPYTAEQLGRALQAIIEEMLDVLEHSEDKINCQHEH